MLFTATHSPAIRNALWYSPWKHAWPAAGRGRHRAVTRAAHNMDHCRPCSAGAAGSGYKCSRCYQSVACVVAANATPPRRGGGGVNMAWAHRAAHCGWSSEDCRMGRFCEGTSGELCVPHALTRGSGGTQRWEEVRPGGCVGHPNADPCDATSRGTLVSAIFGCHHGPAPQAVPQTLRPSPRPRPRALCRHGPRRPRNLRQPIRRHGHPCSGVCLRTGRGSALAGPWGCPSLRGPSSWPTASAVRPPRTTSGTPRPERGWARGWHRPCRSA